MAYILVSENCTGRKFKFIKEGKELLTKGYGKQYKGTLALQTFEDRNYRRITFADSKNVYSGMFRKIFSSMSAIYKSDPVKAYSSGNADYLCHFDFSDYEINSGKKLLKIQSQLCGGFIPVSGLMCYDFTTYTGVSYIFSDSDQLKSWAKKLNIQTFEMLDEDGKIMRKMPCSEL